MARPGGRSPKVTEDTSSLMSRRGQEAKWLEKPKVTEDRSRLMSRRGQEAEWLEEPRGAEEQAWPGGRRKEEERAPRRRPEAARAGERGRLMVTSPKDSSPPL